MDIYSVLKSLSLFVVAGVCEIGGGWLMWKWLRDDKPRWWGLAGAVGLGMLRRHSHAASQPFRQSLRPCTAGFSSCCHCCGVGTSTQTVPTGPMWLAAPSPLSVSR